MTREEAIKRFKTLLLHVDTDCVIGMETTEAINMAIKSLEQPEIIRCKDCIYQTESWNGIKYCEAHGDHIGKDYDYCSNARRRTDEAD